MNEMNVETVDVRFELRELVETPLRTTPIESVAPVGDQFLQVAEVHPIVPACTRQFVWKARSVWTFIAYLAAVSSKHTIWRANVCQFSTKLSRQREDVYGVAAAVRVRLGSQAQAGGSDRAAAAGDGNVLAAVD